MLSCEVPPSFNISIVLTQADSGNSEDGNFWVSRISTLLYVLNQQGGAICWLNKLPRWPNSRSFRRSLSTVYSTIQTCLCPKHWRVSYCGDARRAETDIYQVRAFEWRRPCSRCWPHECSIWWSFVNETCPSLFATLFFSREPPTAPLISLYNDWFEFFFEIPRYTSFFILSSNVYVLHTHTHTHTPFDFLIFAFPFASMQSSLACWSWW